MNDDKEYDPVLLAIVLITIAMLIIACVDHIWRLIAAT